MLPKIWHITRCIRSVPKYLNLSVFGIAFQHFWHDRRNLTVWPGKSFSAKTASTRPIGPLTRNLAQKGPKISILNKFYKRILILIAPRSKRADSLYCFHLPLFPHWETIKMPPCIFQNFPTFSLSICFSHSSCPHMKGIWACLILHFNPSTLSLPFLMSDCSCGEMFSWTPQLVWNMHECLLSFPLFVFHRSSVLSLSLLVLAEKLVKYSVGTPTTSLGFHSRQVICNQRPASWKYRNILKVIRL